jgi:trans-aconitate 2-methyltransferase
MMTPAATHPDTWDPVQYERFREQRSRPFHDLVALVQARPGLRVVDLGCGTGELTLALHRALGARETLGLDRSPAMLGRSAGFAQDGLRFELSDLGEFEPAQPFDVVFSNAALHWVPDQEACLARLTRALVPGGQLAVQLPANFDHASHLAAAEVAGEAPFRETLEGRPRASGALRPEAYAELLHRLGYAEQHVRLQVYGHVLPAREEVIEWVKGTLLTDYRARLGPELYARFEARYREALLARLPDERPFFFPFKRILFWARRPGA